MIRLVIETATRVRRRSRVIFDCAMVAFTLLAVTTTAVAQSSCPLGAHEVGKTVVDTQEVTTIKLKCACDNGFVLKEGKCVSAPQTSAGCQASGRHWSVKQRAYVCAAVAPQPLEPVSVVLAAVRGEVRLFGRDGYPVQPGDVKTGKSVLTNKISTGPNGRIRMVLPDGTNFTVGPDSEVVLDEFVYDRHTDAGEMAAQVTKGLFRFVTGKVAEHRPANRKVKIPAGSLGPRGTDFVVEALPEDRTAISMVEGAMDFTPSGESAAIELRAGDRIVVESDGKLLSRTNEDVVTIERRWTARMK